jgi:hypothetical protein
MLLLLLREFIVGLACPGLASIVCHVLHCVLCADVPTGALDQIQGLQAPMFGLVCLTGTVQGIGMACMGLLQRGCWPCPLCCDRAAAAAAGTSQVAAVALWHQRCLECLSVISALLSSRTATHICNCCVPAHACYLGQWVRSDIQCISDAHTSCRLAHLSDHAVHTLL